MSVRVILRSKIVSRTGIHKKGSLRSCYPIKLSTGFAGMTVFTVNNTFLISSIKCHCEEVPISIGKPKQSVYKDEIAAVVPPSN